MRRVRELQDETGGFRAFIPWTFQRDGNRLDDAGARQDMPTSSTTCSRWPSRGSSSTTSPHIQSSLGHAGAEDRPGGARFGADDLGSMMLEENVVSAAGTTTAPRPTSSCTDPRARQDPGAARHAVPRGQGLELSPGGKKKKRAPVPSKAAVLRLAAPFPFPVLARAQIAAAETKTPSLWPASPARRGRAHAARAGRDQHHHRPAPRSGRRHSSRCCPTRRSRAARRSRRCSSARARRRRPRASTATSSPSRRASRAGPDARVQLESPPTRDRSSAGVLADGTLDIRSVSFYATWQGSGRKRSLNDSTRFRRQRERALHIGLGAATPAVPGSRPWILFPAACCRPDSDLGARRRHRESVRRAVQIPLGGGVLVTRGTAPLLGRGVAHRDVTLTLRSSPSGLAGLV